MVPRLFFTILLLAYCFHKVQVSDLASFEKSFDLSFLILSLLASFASVFLAALRWIKFLSVFKLDARKLRLVSIYFFSCLMNQGLPSTIGGDVYRAVVVVPNLSAMPKAHLFIKMLKSNNRTLAESVSCVLLDRVYGLLGVLSLGSAVIISHDLVFFKDTQIVASVTLALCVSIIMVPSKIWLKFFDTMLSKKGNAKEIAFIKLFLNIHDYKPALLEMLRTIGIHFLASLGLFFALLSVGVPITLPLAVVGFSAFSLLIMVPISLGGWGLREVTLISIFSIFGLDETNVFFGSVLFGLVTILSLTPFTILEQYLKFKRSIGAG